MMAMEEGEEEKQAKKGRRGKNFKVPPIFWAVIPLLPSFSFLLAAAVEYFRFLSSV